MKKPIGWRPSYTLHKFLPVVLDGLVLKGDAGEANRVAMRAVADKAKSRAGATMCVEHALHMTRERLETFCFLQAYRMPKPEFVDADGEPWNECHYYILDSFNPVLRMEHVYQGTVDCQTKSVVTLVNCVNMKRSQMYELLGGLDMAKSAAIAVKMHDYPSFQK